MKTQLLQAVLPEELHETLQVVFMPTRSKVISAADVWNIQRNKRVRAQRRFL